MELEVREREKGGCERIIIGKESREIY